MPLPSRQNWFGAKPIAGRLLTNPAAHWIARAALPPHVRHRLPVRTASVAYVSGPLRVTLLDPYRDQVAKDLYWGGGRPTSRADANVLRYIEAQAQQADIFLDIGCYSGLFAILAAKANPQLRSVAYEILPENHQAIVRNVAANGAQVEVKLLGLSDTQGSITMPTHYGSLSHPSSMSLSESFSDGVQVPYVPLDDEGHDGRILMKIDVEGWEWQVLAGARRTIAACRPSMICEILRNAPNVAEINGLLEPLGYRFFLSRDDGLVERERIEPDETFRDWLLSPTAPPPLG